MQTVDWRRLADGRSWLVLGLAFAALISLAHLIGMLLSPQPAFDGAELDQLRRTGSFIFYGILLLGSAAGAYWLARGWQAPPLGQLLGVVLFAILLALTVRTSFRAAFINYDRATEYLVYAHSATGVKTVLAQIEELSRRTTDGMGIDVGYDDDVSWPFSWYIRQFPNNHYYQNTPSRDLLNYPVVIAGDNNWATVEPILGGRYLTIEYIRMWWPMQDYFDLSWERVWGALRSPEYRVALWDIWFQRDYTAYGQLTGGNFALDRWSPADRMKLYIRRDVAAMIWDYGVAPQALEGVSLVDPYAEGTVALSADPVIAQDVGLTNPRDLVVTEQGDLLVADSGNHRIVKLDATGQVLATWGQFGAPDLAGPQPAFNEPWGLALAPDGSIYVADTWNHRVVHLSADGEPLDSIGEYGEAQTLESFWGPRDVAVDADGRIFVADTGNKRIVVFDTDGNPLFGIGSGGAGPGLLDEPVGLAVGPDGRLYVADTWNQRIQVFEETAPNTFDPVNEWTIDGWYGQSLNNKPYLDVSSEGDVCTSDPEGYRILCFEADGTFSVAWGDLGSSVDRFGLPSGLAFAGQDLWVVDNGNLRLMRFAPPFP
jgi:sugar lactone lactonase YvrE